MAANYKSSTYTTVLVYDDPDQQFLVQEDGSGSTAIATSKIGLNFDHVATTGNGTVIKSRHTMKRGGSAATFAHGSAAAIRAGVPNSRPQISASGEFRASFSSLVRRVLEISTVIPKF